MKELGIDVRMILKWIFKKEAGDVIWLRIKRLAGSCEHSNELSGSVRCWLLMKESAAWIDACS